MDFLHDSLNDDNWLATYRLARQLQLDDVESECADCFIDVVNDIDMETMRYVCVN